MQQKIKIIFQFKFYCIEKAFSNFQFVISQDCMEVCMMNAMLDQHGCINKLIFYPNNFSYCPYHGECKFMKFSFKNIIHVGHCTDNYLIKSTARIFSSVKIQLAYYNAPGLPKLVGLPLCILLRVILVFLPFGTGKHICDHQ